MAELKPYNGKIISFLVCYYKNQKYLCNANFLCDYLCLHSLLRTAKVCIFFDKFDQLFLSDRIFSFLFRFFLYFFQLFNQ